MTLDTRIYVHDPIDGRALFVASRDIIGAGEQYNSSTYANPEPRPQTGHRLSPGQGLCAWLDVEYDSLMTADPACETPARYAEASFDTAYGFQAHGAGCGDLHAAIVVRLGAWLDQQGVRWSWLDEGRGDVYAGDDNLLTTLSGCLGDPEVGERALSALRAEALAAPRII